MPYIGNFLTSLHLRFYVALRCNICFMISQMYDNQYWMKWSSMWVNNNYFRLSFVTSSKSLCRLLLSKSDRWWSLGELHWSHEQLRWCWHNKLGHLVQSIWRCRKRLSVQNISSSRLMWYRNAIVPCRWSSCLWWRWGDSKGLRI